MNKYIRFTIVVFLFFLLILVRAFESKLFYDPFIHYFKNDYLYKEIPKFNSVKLYVHISFRYFMNSFISLGIIYCLFQKQFLKFSVKFYSLAFIILLLLLFFVVQLNLFESYLPIFYIRRFLIHPIFVLLLIPAFYYSKKHA